MQAVLYVLAFILFAAAQVIFFLVNQPLCNVSKRRVSAGTSTSTSTFQTVPARPPGPPKWKLASSRLQVSNGRVNASFLATLLNTGALGVLYYAWIVSLFCLTLWTYQ